MAILTKPQQQSSHWYTRDARAMHRMQLADREGTRPTNLGDARKLGLYPSVSGILALLDKPGLDLWKVKEAVKAATVILRVKDETDDYWMNRVIEHSRKQVDDAADLGTAIHNEIERFLRHDFTTPYTPSERLAKHVKPAVDWMFERQIRVEKPEAIVVNHEHGFAGTSDAPYRAPKSFGVLDYKSKKTKPGEPIDHYFEQACQIAAYIATYWGEAALNHPQCWGGNIFISSTEAGRTQANMYPAALLRNAWDVFKMLCAIWRIENEYDPRVPVGTPQVWPQATVIDISPPTASLEVTKMVVDPQGATPRPTPEHEAVAPKVTVAQPTFLQLLEAGICVNECNGMEFLSPRDCVHMTKASLKSLYSWFYNPATGRGAVFRNDDPSLDPQWMNAFRAFPKDLDMVNRSEGKPDPVVGSNGLPPKPSPEDLHAKLKGFPDATMELPLGETEPLPTPPVPPAPTPPVPSKSNKITDAAALVKLEEVTLKFGKHKGKKLSDLPSTYLDWLRGQPDLLTTNPQIAAYLNLPAVAKSIDRDLKKGKK